MGDSDLPEELDRLPANPDLGNILSRVLSGELVAFHEDKGLVAVWTGGTGFNVYNPECWPSSHGRVNNSGEVYHFNMPDHSQLEDPEQYARETLEGYGFEVVG